MIAVLIYTLLGAFAWRVRGGAWETTLHLPPTTQGARLFCGLVFAEPLALYLGNLWLFGLVLTIAGGLMLMGWGNFMDIGRGGNKREIMSVVVTDGLSLSPTSRWHDALAMSLTMVTMFLISALFLTGLGYVFAAIGLLTGALLSGPIYAGAWAVQDARKKSGATEIAEWIVGGALALGLALGILI